MLVNRPGQPGYSGGHTFCRVPLVLDPAELAGADVVVLGAPVDEATSTRPGTRFGPRAIRHADDTGGVPPSRYHAGLDVDPFEVLRIVDHGDVEVVAGDPEGNLVAIGQTIARIVAAGAIPVVLGGDHSIAYPDIRAAADGRLRIVQIDAHTDTSLPGPGRPRWSHGSPIGLLVEDGVVRGSQIVQIGLRSWWPPPHELEWARAHGIRQYWMDEVEARGIDAVVEEAIADTPPDARLWLSLDVDGADPAYAPGTGTPEPGGLTSREYMRAVLRLTRELDLAGLEVVEVSPPYDQAEITAMLAHRLVLTALTGLAARRAAPRVGR